MTAARGWRRMRNARSSLIYVFYASRLSPRRALRRR